ncbi:HAMP domain-containing sensor histidine kinase [Paractinoplanes brasiliensis]|uniref:Signal transduction histidine-protein kinase/phosphatase MprB n=1 Tax=Paractinoplanes brasiliensis TaxID=52695 RepID=A0A4R6J984_9ACTN|nr:HAMP domain-containing sensor histidine kinase [Actinoplanes brasiliensis]TDO32193.1 two-component system sensor histidine kinase BaeS [Actinoplanes brasiliensis]GID28246.1 two-component sensor histidine kinase [Actinoplanes brasiliensis]
MPNTLAGRTVLVTAATAVVAVIITALVALPLAARSADNAARADLADKAALAVELLAAERPVVRERIVARLRDDGIAVYLIRRGRSDRPGLPETVIRQIADGSVVDAHGVVSGEDVLVAGRPLRGIDSGVVLTRPASSVTAGQVLGGVWAALLAGLAGGVGAGALLAYFTARPLRRAALAAKRLTSGDRSVRLAVRPPAEVAELATALNQLGAALQTSEGREREFLLSVSHELRTPLATIRGYAEALSDRVVTGDEAVRAGETMRQEADRLDRLISDLLVLSRLEAADLPVHLAEVDLTELVDAAGRAWRTRCGPDGPRLTVELPDAPVTVTTDPGRVRQVIDGLCENAVRVIPPGAPLVLAVHVTDRGGTVQVRDGGPGFTDDDLAVAFERGALHHRYRHERKTGSGLGLALAARLVTRLNGTIEAGHAPEGGAMFTITLPSSVI